MGVGHFNFKLVKMLSRIMLTVKKVTRGGGGGGGDGCVHVMAM
jgi:hypothetical protein